MKVSHSVCFHISDIFLRKQKFNLNQDKLLPNLQDGLKENIVPNKIVVRNVVLNNIFHMMIRGCAVMSSQLC